MSCLISGLWSKPFSEGCRCAGTEQGLAPNLVWNGGLSEFEHAFLIRKHFVQTAFVRPPWLLCRSRGFQMTVNRFLWVMPTLRNLLEALGTLGKCWESSKGDSVVNIPIYSPFSVLFIVSITFLISFQLLLFRLYYLEAKDIFSTFSHWIRFLFSKRNIGNMFQTH